MRKLIEATFLTVDGVVDAPNLVAEAWQYLKEEHAADSARLLFDADALLLGRQTYEVFSQAYPRMVGSAPSGLEAFVARMNDIPKYVASTTLHETSWNATLLGDDVAAEVARLKAAPGHSLLKYGTGVLDRTLMEHQLIDEFHFWLLPFALGAGKRLFENADAPRHLTLVDATTFSTGVVLLVYTPQGG